MTPQDMTDPLNNFTVKGKTGFFVNTFLPSCCPHVQKTGNEGLWMLALIKLTKIIKTNYLFFRASGGLNIRFLGSPPPKNFCMFFCLRAWIVENKIKKFTKTSCKQSCDKRPTGMNKSWNVPVIEMDKKWKWNEKFLLFKSSVLQAQTEVHFTDNKNLPSRVLVLLNVSMKNWKSLGFLKLRREYLLRLNGSEVFFLTLRFAVLRYTIVPVLQCYFFFKPY